MFHHLSEKNGLPFVEKQKVREKIHRFRFQDWWLTCTEPDIKGQLNSE